MDADGNLVVWWYVVYADEASAQAAASDPNIHLSVTPAMCNQNQIQSLGMGLYMRLIRILIQNNLE